MKKVLPIFLAMLVAVLFLGTASDQAVAQGKGKLKTIWEVPGDFPTIQAAIDDATVSNGDTIQVKPGSHAGAYVHKSVEIKGVGNAVIDDGPMHPAGLSMGFRFLAGSDGATISNLEFNVDLAIMNGGAVDDVIVDHCTFYNTIQAISNWCGCGWIIIHNEIIDLRTQCGGGIGILVADYSGGVVESNIISNNLVYGTLHVAPGDCGGYSGSGIVLYADFRWGGAGALEIKNNRVVKNKVSLVSDTASVVDVVAFELTDTRDDIDADPYPVIFGNSIGFNDFRGTVNQISLTPDELVNYNFLFLNLGDKRGPGLPSKVYLR